ncbi:MAG: formylglycine-generating enzyme family protein [Rhodobacteraceae bacterium]|nr:formylglycine-generating enzyme family protein [Paracoccaceae bacterium]
MRRRGSLAAGLALAAVAGLAGLLAAGQFRPAAPLPAPATVTLPAGSYAWRPFGAWRRDGVLVPTPLLAATAPVPIHVMRDLVTRADYARCVAEHACPPAEAGAVPAAAGGPAEDYPQTGVSWQDAQAYAAWLSARSGRPWRLPTDAEWQRAAAERFGDDGVAAGGGDIAARWLAEYDRTTLLRGRPDPVLRPSGGWGRNSLGLADMAGNVWEWTQGCVTDAAAVGEGPFVPSEPYCGVRIAEGRHRAPVIDFVRDASAGGCGLGIPPDYLGFRLVSDAAG